MAQTVSKLPTSIQGELLGADPTTWHMDEGDVDLYVDEASPEVIECRERGRHLWPSTREVGIVFTDVDDLGLFVRRLKCKCCGLAYRNEKWDAVKRGGTWRYVLVGANVVYKTGAKGEQYLAPAGRGHLTSKLVKSSLASKALSGESPAAMRKQLKRKAS